MRLEIRLIITRDGVAEVGAAGSGIQIPRELAPLGALGGCERFVDGEEGGGSGAGHGMSKGSNKADF